jgi:phosphomannomutase
MRGEIGAGLNPLLAMNFASALGTYLESGRIVIGTDTRFSSPMLRSAALAALVSAGCEVFDAGVCPAPLLHFIVPVLKAAGGLLIGAGHHPCGWNALVPFAGTGAYFNRLQTQELLEVYHSQSFTAQSWNKIGQVHALSADLADQYLEVLTASLDLKAIRNHNYKVLTDFCNGSGSVMAGRFAERLGVTLVPINDSLSGVLPHDPEPRPRSSTQVQSMVRALKADIGFVFNSDMSRTAVVGSDGETLSEEYTFPLVADHVLARYPRPTGVVTNWCTTRTLDDIVAKHQGHLFKTKVGQAFIMELMSEIDARLAGDGSGSVALGKAVLGFDGFAAMGVILEAMALQDCSSAALAEALPRYHLVKRKINCPSAHAYSLMRSLKNQFPDASCSEEDGFRFDWKDGWVHLRSSMTEPIIRMIVEWRNREEAEERAMHLRGVLERLVAS